MPQAGTAWVPVYPDTRRIPGETRRAFSQIGDQSVDVVPRVRDMASVRTALAALPHVVVPVDVEDRKIMELRAQLQALGNRRIGVDISADQANAELAAISAQLSALSNRSARIDVQVDAAAASSALSGVSGEVRRLDGRRANIAVIADTARAITGIVAILRFVNQLDGQNATIEVVADTGRATAGLAMVATAAFGIGGAVGSVAALGAAVLALGPAGAIAAGGFGAAKLAFAGVGDALSALGAQQDAAGKDAAASAQQQAQSAMQVQSAQERLADASGKAGQARSDSAREVSRAVVAAEKGVEQAQQRVQSAERSLAEATAAAAQARSDGARSVARARVEAEKSVEQALDRVASQERSLSEATAAASKARVDAAESVRSAETQAQRSIASARQQAQRSIASATAAQTSADQRLQRATRDLAREQSQLTRAWEQGRRSLEDFQDQADSNALDQRQAAYDLADARKELVEAQASGDADKIGRAQLGVDRQIEAIDQLGKRTRRGLSDNAAAQRAGVAGSEEYRRAMERVGAAQEQVSDTARAAGAADHALVAARVEGAQAVALAETDGAARIASARREGADKTAAADARVADARRSLAEAEAGVEDARVEGAQRVADAREQGARAAMTADAAVLDARRLLAEAEAGVEDARVEGAQRVADAREQGARAIAAADKAVIDAQRALQQAMAQTAASASSTGDEVAAAFAKLSPAAADFAWYLWSLKPLLDRLSATAATAFFPPLRAGLEALVTQFPIVERVVGQFAGAAGAALGFMLAQLASPLWMGFFTTLGNAAGPIMMQLAQVLMHAAAAVMGLIIALLPLTPLGLRILAMVADLVAAWTPFIVLLVAALLPAAAAVIQALMPLGPVLAALGPILAVIATAFAMVLGAVLQALAPILVALTPLIVQLAMAFAVSMVNAIVALTPWLVALATWMSEHPGLVLFLVGALGALITGWKLASAIVATLLGPLLLLRLAMRTLGVGAGAIGAAFGGLLAKVAGPVGAFIAKLQFNVLGLANTFAVFLVGALSKGAAALGGFVRALLVGLGPVTAFILILTGLFLTNEAFRAAVMGLLSALGQVVAAVLAAVLPALAALLPVLQFVGWVFAGIANGLATALIPVLNLLASWISFIAPVLGPMIAIFLGIVAAVKLWTLAQWALNTALAMNPITLLVIGIAALVGAVVWAYQSFSWFRTAVDAVGGAFVWVWQTVLAPVVNFLWSILSPAIDWIAANWRLLAITLGILVGPIGWVVLAFTFFRDQTMAVLAAVGGALMWLWQTIFVPAWSAISAVVSFAWNNIIWPVLSALWTALRVLGAVLFVIIVAPFLIAWNLISAAISFAWNSIILPVFNALVLFINLVLVPLIRFLYENVVRPIFAAIGAAIALAWYFVILPVWNALVTFINTVIIPLLRFLLDNVVRPIWDGIGIAISFVWNRAILPIWNALVTFINVVIIPLLRFLLDNVVKPIWDGIGTAIRIVWENVIRPAWDAVAGGLTFLRDRFRDAVAQIGQVWNGIRPLLAKPINFMIDVVWNRGVVPAWNKVAGLVGLGPIQPLPMIPEFARGGVYQPHRYTPGRDIGLAAVGGNEAIMRPEWTRVVGHDYVHAANAAARHGGTAGVSRFLDTTRSTSPSAEGAAKQQLMRRYPLDDTTQRVRGSWAGGFAYGGVAPHVAFAGAEVERMFGRLPGGIGGVGSRANASDHTSGHALDFMTLSNMGLGDRIAGHMEQHAERLAVKYIIWKQAINQGKGWRGMEDRGSTTANHFDHPHVSFEGGPLGGKWGDGPMGGGGGFSFNPLPGIVRGIMDGAKDFAVRAVTALTGQPPPDWRRVPPAYTTKAFDTMRDWAAGKAEAIFGGGAGAMGPTGKNAPFYTRQIADAARMMGLGREGALVGVATALVETDMRMAANPRDAGSLGFPHDWVSHDHDSSGLFQQRPNGEWGTVAERMNALASALMFFKAMLRIVGPGWRANLGDAAARTQRPAAQYRGRYAQRLAQATGLVNAHGGPFDDGGEAWGTGFLFKDVIAPERVLPPRETQAYPTLTKLSQQLAAGQVPVASAEVAAARAAAMSGPLPVQFPSSFRLSSDTALRLDGDGVLHIVDGRLHALADAFDAGRPD